MTVAELPLLGTLIEQLIETSLRLQGSLCGEVPEGINGELLECGGLLNEIRQQAAIAAVIVPSSGHLKARLGYLREILESNDALVREGAAYGDFSLRARAGGAEKSVYSEKGLPAASPAGGVMVNTRG
jgi:hypothetical protein